MFLEILLLIFCLIRQRTQSAQHAADEQLVFVIGKYQWPSGNAFNKEMVSDHVQLKMNKEYKSPVTIYF